MNIVENNDQSRNYNRKRASSTLKKNYIDGPQT